MAAYAESGQCRWKVLLDYFNEGDGFERCETCDNCRRTIEPIVVPPPDPAAEEARRLAAIRGMA